MVVGNEKYGLINIRIGIFQAYSLLPLLFVIAMILLSVILKKSLPINKNSVIEFYKNFVRIFSIDIAVEFGLEKRATVSRNQDKITKSNRTDMPNEQRNY